MVYFKLVFGLGRKKQKNMTPQQNMTGWDFVNIIVDKVKKEGRFKTASNYLTAIRSWSKFIGHNDWQFSEMDADNIWKFQRWLGEQGICMNTISAYMRALRALYNRQIDNGGIARTYPFAKAFTGREKTNKRSISETEIMRLHALELSSKPSLALARDIFLFSFYAMGMPFVDIAYLKSCQIQNGYIRYARHKTGQRIQLAIEPRMLEIINRYDSSKTGYVFPLLTGQMSEALHKQYLRCLRRYNYSLKRLSVMIGASRSLSSYVVRHSWASIAYQHHIDVALIGKALGHTKTATTMLYIKSLFDPDLADANRTLMEEIGF